MKNKKVEELEFVVESEYAGIRIDKCITLKLGEGYSRMYVKYLMDNGCVRVNEKKVKPHYMASEGDNVFLELLPLSDDNDIEPENIPLDIVHEDKWIIVINKPAGMVVHPGAGNRTGTLVNALLYYCDSLPKAGGDLRPGIVHRLDKDTTGIIVVAKNERALRLLSKQFQNRTVKKRYIAIVKGRVEMDNGIVDAPLARHAVDRKKMDVDYTGGKESCTHYHVIRRFEKATLISLGIKTGRTHQIRVHMNYIGYPVIGDITYGRIHGMSRQALHAEMIGFTHPYTGKYVEFTTPIPEDMKELIKELDKKK